MRIFTSEQIKNAENRAVELGDNFLNLMENAGEACFEAILNKYDLNEDTAVAVVCGKGKNAGDGFVIARKLSERGVKCAVVLSSGMPTAPDSQKMLHRIGNVEVTDYTQSPAAAKGAIHSAAYIVDAIIGFGFHGVPKPALCEVIECINAAKGKVISIDLPTGLDCDSGLIGGACVKADFTVAISTLKPVHVTYPAAEKCGSIEVVSIGMPEDSFAPFDDFKAAVTEQMLFKMFKKRRADSNKGSFGKVLSVCGSLRMPGAAVFAANAAVHSGAGLVTAAFPKCIYNPLTAHLTEPLFLPLSENDRGTLSASAADEILEEMSRASVCMFGCGQGCNEDTRALAAELIKNAECPLVIDADGINCIADNIDILKAAKVPVILTPHPGEMSRLTGQSIAEIQSQRIETARSFAREYSVVLVLKGAGTVVSDGEKVFVNTTGNPGMAQGGSGDVLTGIISSFIAQGMSPIDAAVSAAYLHGAAGDSAAGALSQRGMTPTDLINRLPLLLLQYEQQGDV